MKIEWHKENNFVDCGVFAMCHMESYMGEAEGEWHTGIQTENQKNLLTGLRIKYASKILTHDVNMYANDNIKSAKEFSKGPRSVYNQLIKNAVENRNNRIL